MSRNISSKKAQNATIILAFALVVAGCEEEMDNYGISIDENALLQDKGALERKHCVGESTVYSAKDNSLLSEPDSEPMCFKTFSRAIEYATGGRVMLSEDATPETVTDEEINGPIADSRAISTAASYVIGIEYEHYNHQGATFTITSGVTCDGYIHSYTPITGAWNDTISSARAYSLCGHSLHYEHWNFGGASIDCGTSCSSVGAAMNDRTSSLKWWK